MPKPYPEEFRRTLLDLVAAGRHVARQEIRVIYRCRDRDQAAARLYVDCTVTRIHSHVPELRRLARSGRDHPCKRNVRQRVIEPTGIATHSRSIQKVGIVRPLIVPRRPPPATMRADSQSMYPVAVVPRPAWTEGRAKGT